MMHMHKKLYVLLKNVLTAQIFFLRVCSKGTYLYSNSVCALLYIMSCHNENIADALCL